MRFLFILLAFLVLFNSAFGLHNDPGNDSCLTIYSDKKDYAVGSLDKTIRTELIFDNRCGKEIKDLKLGLFLEDRILSEVSFESIYSFEPKIETVKNKSFVCNYTLTTASITNQTTCIQTIVDANLSRTDKTLWAGVADSIAGNTIFWTEKEVKPAKWGDKTKVLKPSTDIKKIGEKPDFDLKTGWQEITLPLGESRMKVLFTVPIGYEGKKEFVVKAYSDKDDAIVSVLDPNWYDSACAYRKKITLKTSNYLTANVANDHVIYVKQVAADTDFWGHETTGDHVRFTAADGSTLLKYYFQRFNDTNDLMDAWVKVTDTFTSAANIDIYMYYGCAGFSNGQDVANTLTNYLAAYHSDEGTGTAVADKKGSYNATADNALIWDTATQKIGAAGLNPAGSYSASNGTLLDTMPANLSFSFWLNPTTHGSKTILNKNNGGGWTEAIQITNTPTGLIRFITVVGGVESDDVFSTTTMSTGTWYHAILTWNTTNGKIVYFNGVNEGQDASKTTLMGNGTAENFYIGSYLGAYNFIGKMDEVKVMSVGLDGNEAMLLYRSENSDLQTYGAEESGNTAPDLNIWKAGIYDFNSGLPFFKKDVNITITFTVFDAENDRLTIDLNYSTVPTQGTGIPFAKDLNLTSAFCPVQNWNTGISVCSFDWNAGANDGNYYILAKISDSSLTDFNFSASTIGIDSNAPYVINWFLLNDLNGVNTTFSFWVHLGDTNSGAKGAWYGKYKNGVLDGNGFADVNANGFAITVSSSLDANLDSAFIIWYAFSDKVDNNWNYVIKSGVYTRIFWVRPPVKTYPYYSQDDSRLRDSNRYFVEADKRLSDESRYLAQVDERQKRVSVSGLQSVGFVQENNSTILFYITICVIIAVIGIFVWKWRE